MGRKVILLGSAFPYKVGSSQFNERLSQEFANEGDEITIFTFKLQYPSFLFPGKSQFTDKPKENDLVIERKINSINPFNWINVGREIKKLKPDLLVVRYMMPFFSPSMGTISRIAKKNKITQVAAIIDNAIPHEKRIGDTLLSKYFFKSIDRFIYMSQKVKTDLATFGIKEKIYYSPHPLFDFYGDKISKTNAANKLNLDESFKYVLFFGIIRDYKGLDLLLESFNHTYFKENKIKLIIAGECYTDCDVYKSYIKENKMAEQIVFLDRYIAEDEVSLLFSVSDLLVLPYKSATQSGVTQVGFYYDTPMLVTNVGGLGELINPQIGYVVEPDSSAIQNSLLDFYKLNKKESLSKAISLKKKEFSWARMVNVLRNSNNEDKK